MLPRVREHVEDVAFGLRSVNLIRRPKRSVLLPVALPSRLYRIERVRFPLLHLRLRIPADGTAVGGGTTPDSNVPSGRGKGDYEGKGSPVNEGGEGLESQSRSQKRGKIRKRRRRRRPTPSRLFRTRTERLQRSPSLCPSPPLLRYMSPLSRLRLRLPAPLHRRALTALAAAVQHDTDTWSQAPLSLVAPASADATLFHVAVDVSDAPDLAVSYTAPGQYLQLRVPGADKPAFLAIASPPSFAASRCEFQFLVKRVPGSTVDLLCGLGRGDIVELSGIMGRGFRVEEISPPDAFPSVLIFATGSGIRWDSVPFGNPKF
ncbi:hypothetical protein BHE74_00008292 [Ensete ventricosum]|nr:hypothetical protein GW17_00022576 [Ensete ventricosum]RWW83207.1 hypothetical protein BHE74_00008292 [Ensete ventricosum]RZR78924.1 hypothetical protein BHM03_00004485 [Ensete ventricosum]